MNSSTVDELRLLLDQIDKRDRLKNISIFEKLNLSDDAPGSSSVKSYESSENDEEEVSGEDLVSIFNEPEVDYGEIESRHHGADDKVYDLQREDVSSFQSHEFPHKHAIMHAVVAHQEVSNGVLSLHQHDEKEIIKRLLNEIGEKTVSLRSLEMQLAHSVLQVQALTLSETQLRRERDELHQVVAISEQDILLLEVKPMSIELSNHVFYHTQTLTNLPTPHKYLILPSSSYQL